LLVPIFTSAADKNGVSANAVSLPSGPGSIEGLGESFEPSLNNGTARYGLSLLLPPGTAGHTPTIRFSYDGGQGNGPLGFGWSMPLPYIQRQTDKGIPRYVDSPNSRDDDRDGQVDEADELDTFINDGKEELVPLANGDYFCENEESFIRYRRVGDHWEGTLPNGTRMEFGLTDEGRILDSATNHVFKWLLQRQTDTRGNTIVYSWQTFASSTNRHQKFLKEIRYGPGAGPWTHFHFAAFTYEDRTDWFEDCRSGFIVRTGKRLKEVAIGTQGVTPAGHAGGDFNADGQPDVLNRKYRLTYLDYAPGQSHWSLLRDVTQVGADGVSTLPPARFGYAICHPPEVISASGHFIGGTNEPPFAMDNANVELVDLNGDALPDLLRTGAAGGAHIAYLNRGGQTNGAIGWSAAQQINSADGFAWNVNLQSATDVAHLSDMNGDGLADLAYKTALGDVFFFANQGSLGWGNRQFMSPQDTQPPAAFGNANVRTADIDFDKRIDVIESLSSGGGADYRVWFNLGNQRYARSLTIPQTAGFLFSQAGVHVADFNGDRVPDILRLQATALTVTAGLGHGNFAPPVIVGLPDWTLDSQQIAKARLEDITGDGLTDLVIERAAPGQVWYWINKGNYTLDPRRVITGLPGGLAGTTRWADLNGNGTTDLIFADSTATPKMLTVDLGQVVGCVPQPNTLTQIENGIGRVTTIEYAPSTRFALEDAAAGHAWTNRLPFPLTVVARVLTGDSLGHSYEARFRYHEGYYDSVEKEFRGFARVEKIEVGDSTAPTLVTRSYFDTGRQFESMKGKRLRLTAEQEDGQTFWDEVMAWGSAPRILYTGTNGQTVKFVHPIGKIRTVKELGQGVERVLESEFAYDTYGNQTLDANYGIVENGDRSAFNDERITTNQFALNLAAWIVRTPSRIEVHDENGVVISRTDDFYDDETFSGNNLGAVQVGNPTMRREWHTPADPGGFVASSRSRYDVFGNAITLLDPLAAPSGDPSQGHSRGLEYDAEFHTFPVAETIHLGAGKSALVMGVDYDLAFGKITASRDFNAQETTYGYDVFARLSQVVRPGDTAALPTTEYAYAIAQPVGSNGLVNYVETRRLDAESAGGGKLDHYHIARQFSDGLGRAILSKSEAEGDSTSPNTPRAVVTGATIFNARQKPSLQLNPFFSMQPGATLDELLAFESIEAPGWQGQFHDSGNLVNLGLAAAHQTATTYDALLREREVTNPDGTQRRRRYEPLVTEASDENDTNPASPHAGTPHRFFRDGLDRHVRTDERVRLNDDGTAAGELQTWTTTYEWDLNDQLTRVADAQGNVKTMQFDSLRRLVSMNDPDRGVSTNSYDAASNRTSTRDAKGQVTRFTYDGANRLLTEDYLDDGEPFSHHHAFNPGQPVTAQNRPDAAFFYDASAPSLDLGDGTTGTASQTIGNLAFVWDLSGEEHFSYDARGRTEWTVKRVFDPTHQQMVSFRTRHEFDSLDRETRLIYPDNDAIEFDYNRRTLPSRIAGGPSGSIVAQLDYLPSGQTAKTVYGNGVQSKQSFDSRQRLHSLQTLSAGAPEPSLLDFDYTFDDASNLTGIADQRPVSAVTAGTPRRNTQSFTYDNLNRLTQAQYHFGAPGQNEGDDGAIEFRYDRIGNLLQQNSSVSTEPDAQDADLGMLSYGGAAGASGRVGRTGPEPGPHAMSNVGNDPLTYDANGNVAGMDGFALTWDFKNRLVTAENDQVRADYAYDHADRRITRRVTRKACPMGPDKTESTLYVGRHFEVRHNAAPIKYVFNASTRVARVTGSLSTRARIQRLAVCTGWNLVSLAVNAEQAGAQLKQGGVVTELFQWDVSSKNYKTVSDAATLPAGTVLWLNASANTTLSVTGDYADPQDIPVSAGGCYLASAGLEAIDIADSLPLEPDAWMFGGFDQHWHSRLSQPAGFSNGLPRRLAPGEAIFINSTNATLLEVPESALRIRYYHQDHLGSSGVITDAAGHLVEETAYLPFGGTRHSFRPRGVTEAYGFTQKEQDAETGLHYFEARFLASRFGRFASVDPLYVEPHQLTKEKFQSYLENPQKLNLYSYVLNRPMNMTDPTGLDGLEGVSIGVQVSGALLEVGGEVGLGVFVDFESGKVAVYGSYGYGVAIGLGVGASVNAGVVNDSDAFWGTAYEYGVNTPVAGVCYNVAPDADDPDDDAGLEGMYGVSGGIGPSLGGDVHYFRTETVKLGETDVENVGPPIVWEEDENGNPVPVDMLPAGVL
jgi:RHS repeat-associated protein